MTKADLHVKMEPDVADAIRRYAKGNGLNFTAALTSLAVRGLRAEGITISGPAEHQHEGDGPS